MAPKQEMGESTEGKTGRIPTRYIMTFLAFCCCTLSFMARTDINLTIVVMVNQTGSHSDNETIDENDECPSEDKMLYLGNSTNENPVTYDWDSDTQSLLLSSFYYGSICTQVLGGFLSERFGSKWLLGGAILISAILSLLTPLTASWSVVALIALRVATGLVLGVVFPCLITFINAWSPSKERSTLTMIAWSGTTIGTIFAMEVGGFLSKYGFAGGWPSVYYVFGSLSIIWCIFWTIFAYDSPDIHPRISEKEKRQIQENVVQTIKQPMPWKSILTSMPVLAFVVARSCSSWTLFITLIELPTYLNRVLHFSIETNGTINSSVYVIGAVASIASARLADWLLSRDRSNPTVIRKMMQNFGHYGSAAVLLCIPLVGCNRSWVITLIIVAKAFSTVSITSDINIVSDMARSYSGTIFGIGNTIAAVMGLLAPILTGAFIKNKMGSLSAWTWIFSITAAIEVFGAIFFLIFADAEKQSWAIQTQTD